MSQGILYTISAPSGAGKSSLVKALLENTDNLKLSVSHTTRQAREGEIDGVNYNFVSKDDFKQMLVDNLFLEHALIFTNNYGTLKKWLMEQLKQGIDIILEIDWQGAQKVRHFYPEMVSIFILPPSYAALEERLRKRATDSEEVIIERLSGAAEDISHYIEYDYLVVNDDFSQALTDLQCIIKSQSLRRVIHAPKIEKVFSMLKS